MSKRIKNDDNGMIIGGRIYIPGYLVVITFGVIVIGTLIPFAVGMSTGNPWLQLPFLAFVGCLAGGLALWGIYLFIREWWKVFTGRSRWDRG